MCVSHYLVLRNWSGIVNAHAYNYNVVEILYTEQKLILVCSYVYALANTCTQREGVLTQLA